MLLGTINTYICTAVHDVYGINLNQDNQGKIFM